VLLPNASVTEVISASNPERVASTPEWLLGRVGWRGWRIPLFSFSLLAGMAMDERQSGGRVTVIKALGGNPKLPYIAMLAQGFPRLTTISPEILLPSGDGGMTRPGVLMDVLVRDDTAVIPDLLQIEQLVSEALAAA
jgi:chemosensory pili system protein ChpC